MISTSPSIAIQLAWLDFSAFRDIIVVLLVGSIAWRGYLPSIVCYSACLARFFHTGDGQPHHACLPERIRALRTAVRVFYEIPESRAGSVEVVGVSVRRAQHVRARHVRVVFSDSRGFCFWTRIIIPPSMRKSAMTCDSVSMIIQLLVPVTVGVCLAL